MKSTVQFNQSKIHYTITGKGNTVVLLHGFTESLAIWDSFKDVLCIDYKVLCIDLPGHGNSECVSETHTMEIMAECVKKVLDAQNISECVLIGHSMGGYVALAFASIFPEMVIGLGLFHSSALPDTPEGKVNRARAIEVIQTNHKCFISTFIPDLFAPENRETLKDEIDELMLLAKNMTKEAIIAAQKGMMERKDQRSLLGKLKIPFLFIAGKKDTRVPFDKVLEQIAIPNDSVALLLGDVAHMGYLEAPEKTLYAVNCFVKGAFV